MIDEPIIDFKITPTIFLVRRDGKLKQVLKALIKNAEAGMRAEIECEMKGAKSKFIFDDVASYESTHLIEVDEVKEPAQAIFTLSIGNERRTRMITITPQRHWLIYGIHHTHTDIGYTDLQTRVYEKHLAFIDQAMEYCRATDDFPEGAKFKWVCEVSWQIKHYLENRPADKIYELMYWIGKGRIEPTALYLQLTELYGHEEYIRMLYFANKLRRDYGLDITCAMNTDVPGFTWALPQMLVKSRIKYFSASPNYIRAKSPTIDKPFYWVGANGDKVLTWYADPQMSYGEGKILGVSRSYDIAYESLPKYLEKMERDGYPYDAISLRTGWLDNQPPILETAEIAKEWNERWAYPKLMMSTNREFFEYMEGKYRDVIPEYRGAWADWWADGNVSAAYETSLSRATQGKLIATEEMETIASTGDDDRRYPKEDIDKAYDSLIFFDEHTWGYYGSIDYPHSYQTKGQWAIKSSFIYNASLLTDELLDNAKKHLFSQISVPDKAAIAVFNPLSWRRSDLTRVFIPRDIVEEDKGFSLIDPRSGEEIAYQVLSSIRRGLFYPEEVVEIAFIGRDIPSLGYQTFKFIPQKDRPTFESRVTTKDNTIENKFYRIVLDEETGGITSIYDKGLRVELVDKKSRYKLNQYIFETPEGGRKSIDDREKGTKFHRSSPTKAEIEIGWKGPVMTSLIAKTRGDKCPDIEQEVILYEGIKRVDIVNRLTKEANFDPEGIYYAFPFNVPDSEIRCEFADAIAIPEKEQLPGTCRDWYSIQYWADISNPEYGVTWATMDTPLIQLGGINTGKWLRELKIDNSTLFAFIMNNYWYTNFPASQSGELTFRFSITSHKGSCDNISATRFGWSYNNPFVTATLRGEQRGALSATNYSGCEVDKPNVIVLDIKKAEDGRGAIVRLLEVKGESVEAKIILPFVKSEKAFLTDLTENDIKPLEMKDNSLSISIEGFGLATFRVL